MLQFSEVAAEARLYRAPNIGSSSPRLRKNPHRLLGVCLHYNNAMPESHLDRVLRHLARYEHPLLAFDARSKGEAVEIVINFKNPPIPVHTYYFELHPRDLESPQLEWTLQRQLYDCLHDYFVEMFTRTPQSRPDFLPQHSEDKPA